MKGAGRHKAEGMLGHKPAMYLKSSKSNLLGQGKHFFTISQNLHFIFKSCMYLFFNWSTIALQCCVRFCSC